jgi:Helix-turn-helix domain
MKKESVSVRLQEQWANGERLPSALAGQKHYTAGKGGELGQLVPSKVRGLLTDESPEPGGGWVLPPACAINSNTSPSSWLIDDKQAAVLLGVAPATLRSWRCRGIGPAYVKLGLGPKAACRYTRHDIEAFIAKCRQVPSVRAAWESPNGNL